MPNEGKLSAVQQQTIWGFILKYIQNLTLGKIIRTGSIGTTRRLQ